MMMKEMLKRMRVPTIISIGSILFAISILALCLSHKGELRSEGAGIILGYLGIPFTYAGSLILMLLPESWVSDDFSSITCAVFFIAQWQLVAWLVSRWLNHQRETKPHA